MAERGLVVAVDATTVDSHMSGVGYYTYRLLQGLGAAAEAGSPARVVAVSNRPVAAPLGDRVHLEVRPRFPVRSAWMQLALPFVLRDVRPDVVHFTNYLAPVLCPAPYVVSVHDMTLALMPEHHTLKKRLLTASLVPTIARRARLVLVPSQSTAKDVVRLLGLPESRLRVIPYAASERFRPDPGPDEEPAGERYPRPYFLYVGTLEPRKNLPRALRAFARIAARLPDHQFVLVGQRGWRYEETLAEAARPELRGRVVFADYVPEAQLPAVYRGAAALVYPSLYEGFGFPVLEGMASGTPVLTSRTSSLGEIGADAALLVDPTDEAALADALLALGTDESLRRDLRERGLARAARFSWAATVRETLAAYREALALPDPPCPAPG